MGQSGAIFARGMAFSIQRFAWVDPYFDFGHTTSYYNTLFNVSGWKGVKSFFGGMNEI